MAEPLISRGGWGPLLAAKCSIPPPRPGGVVRRRLHDLLLANASTRLTAVAAPAGWGKTTLLSQWAHDPLEHRRVAWVSLDESDDEPVRFWTYVMTALRPHGLGAGSLSALGAPGVDPIDVAVPLLLNELESAADAVVLVLDDYHLLSDSRVHEGVEFLLAYLPPSLRLVVAGRADPPLPLPRLRARGELTEIRAADLRFSAPRSRSARRFGRGRRAGRLRGARVVRADRGLGGRAAARRDHRARRGGAAGGPRRNQGRRPAHPGLLHRRGVRPPARCAPRPAGPGVGAGAAVRAAVRRGAAAHRVGRDPRRPQPGGPVRRRPRPTTTSGTGAIDCSATPCATSWIRRRLGRTSAAPPTGSSSTGTSRTPSSTASTPATTGARPSCSGPRRRGSSSAAPPGSPGWATASPPRSPTPTPPCASRWPGPPRSAAGSPGWGRGSTRPSGGPTVIHRWGGTTCAPRWPRCARCSAWPRPTWIAGWPVRRAPSRWSPIPPFRATSWSGICSERRTWRATDRSEAVAVLTDAWQTARTLDVPSAAQPAGGVQPRAGASQRRQRRAGTAGLPRERAGGGRGDSGMG